MGIGREVSAGAPDRLGWEARFMPDEAAFYGPKIDVKLVDAIGRKWQLHRAVRLHAAAPFELEFTGEDNRKHQPLIHRALFGSVERFFGILVEHYAGAFPVWLAPVQATLLPISDRHAPFARKVMQELKTAGLRVTIDERSEKVQMKIRDAQLDKIPFMLVVGDKEVESGAVSVRNRKHGDLGAKPVSQFIAEAMKLITERTPVE
jgi:threonyl-tRNA synthetase